MREPGWDGIHPAPTAEEALGEERIVAYLDAVRAGGGLDLAARAIEETGTSIRRLRRRDAGFRERVEEAERDAQRVYRDRLRASARQRATTPGEGFSARILEVELATHVPGYEHLRRDRVKVDASVETSFTLPADLDAPLEKLLALRALILELGGEVVDGEAVELPPGDE